MTLDWYDLVIIEHINSSDNVHIYIQPEEVMDSDPPRISNNSRPLTASMFLIIL